MINIKLKPVEEYSDGELLYMLLAGIGDANFEARWDQGLYQKYLAGNTADFDEKTMLQMKALEMLLQLGYPEDHLGTYLYEALIANMSLKLQNLQKYDSESFVKESKKLLLEYADGFTKPYRLVAREERDMGVKTFHRYVNDAISKVDYNKADPALAFNIYDGLPNELSMSENAYAIATYMLGVREVKHQAKMPYIKSIYSDDK